MSQPCHVVHIVYRFATGGLENVLVQLVNGLPQARYRHTIIALTQIDAAFAARIRRPDVELISLDKAPGQPYRLYPQMYRLLRRLRPDVVHTSNLAALEFMPVAMLAGVPRRIHAEHGWDVADPDGSNRRYQWLRRAYRFCVHDFIAVSDQLQQYLEHVIGVPPRHVHRVSNGVDTEVFRPARTDDVLPSDYPFVRGQHWVIGSVGRLEPIKNQTLLVAAFIRLLRQQPALRNCLRLALVGAGPLAPDLQQRMAAAGLGEHLWLPGARDDIPALLRIFDCFVLPSLAEGTSCTLQEAMASGVPVVATAVGGNPALLQNGELGRLVASADEAALADALADLYRRRDEPAGTLPARESIIRRYSLDAMLGQYERLFSGA